jgi:hypothetical protein
MSRFAKYAKLISKNEILTKNLFSFFTQLVIYSKSSHYIKFYSNLTGSLGNGLIGEPDIERKEDALRGLALLRPDKFDSKNFVRFGPNADGGYVVFDSLKKINHVITIGVAKDTAFEEHLNSHYPHIEFDLFDHTDKPVRVLPENFHFHNIGLALNSQENKISIGELLNKFSKNHDDLILKIDIEGNEYEAFNHQNLKLLKSIDQILIEIHFIDENLLRSKKFVDLITGLRENFFLAHIHGNNNDSWVNVFGAIVPKTLELTFINKKYSEMQIENSVIFPRELDYANSPGNEMYLGAFIFPLK